MYYNFALREMQNKGKNVAYFFRQKGKENVMEIVHFSIRYLFISFENLFIGFISYVWSIYVKNKKVCLSLIKACVTECVAEI